MVESEEAIDKLFYELANESRLGILRELQVGERRLLEIARKMDLTDTEASRQIQRLTDALLIEKQPSGMFRITEYGMLLMQFSRSFGFALKFKKALLRRDLSTFPEAFTDRMGELLQATVTLEQYEMVNIFERIVAESDKYLHFIARRPMHIISQQAIARAGTINNFDLRSIFSEEKLNLEFFSQHYNPLVERRIISQLPAELIVSEKSAVLSLGGSKGRTDYAIFTSKDPAFLNWANDLFDYYWQRGTPYTVGKQDYKVSN